MINGPVDSRFRLTPKSRLPIGMASQGAGAESMTDGHWVTRAASDTLLMRINGLNAIS